MDKRLRSLTLIVCILVCTIVAAASVVVCTAGISTPLMATLLGVLTLGAAFTLYLLFTSIIKEEKEYHGADYAAMIDSITGGVLVLDGNDLQEEKLYAARLASVKVTFQKRFEDVPLQPEEEQRVLEEIFEEEEILPSTQWEQDE